MAASSWWMWSHLCRMSAECLLVSLVWCGVVWVKSVDMNINCARPATNMSRETNTQGSCYIGVVYILHTTHTQNFTLISYFCII